MARLHSAVAGRARPLRERATCSQLAGMWCACCCRETASFSKKQMRLVWGGGSARCKTCVAAAEAAKREEERRAKQRRLDAELTLLLFAREASWLVATATSGNVFKTELVGAEVGSGNDSITLIFTAVLTEEDIQSINHIRSTLSNRMGSHSSF